MNRSFLKLAAVAALLLLLTACGGTTTTADPYADPGTPAPATIADPTISTSGSLAPSTKGAGLYDINVAGFAQPEALAQAGMSPATIADLPASAFTVVEDGVVKGITVERIGGSTRAAADVVFVFDTTGSMGSALSSVQRSILAFVDHLDEGGLDVNLGAVTFGDVFDTQEEGGTRGVSLRGDTPTTFDPDERPTFELSSDFEAFREFIEGDSPRWGNDNPENGLGAVEFAFDELQWRAGAQRLMILITDICMHTPESYASSYGHIAGSEHWAPPVTEELLSRLRGNATVHVMAPANASLRCPAGVALGEELTGPTGTGGVYVDWDLRDFDLTELPIASAARSGYVITYRGTEGGEPKDVRVVIDDKGDVRGEFTIVGSY